MSQRSGQATVERSLHGLASTLAVIATILVSGQVYDLTADPMFNYLLNAYGDHFMATVGMYAWIGAALACVFFLTRAVLALAVLLIAQRLLVFAL